MASSKRLKRRMIHQAVQENVDSLRGPRRLQTDRVAFTRRIAFGYRNQSDLPGLLVLELEFSALRGEGTAGGGA